MRLDSQIVGYLQNVSVDFGYDIATLYGGKGMFPVDVRVHTGNITGSAEYADLTATGVEKLIGGTRTGTSIAISNTSSPATFQVSLDLTTDTTTFTITLNRCRSSKLAFPFVRDGHVIPSFDFSAEADDDNNVGIIDLGDES